MRRTVLAAQEDDNNRFKIGTVDISGCQAHNAGEMIEKGIAHGLQAPVRSVAATARRKSRACTPRCHGGKPDRLWLR
jgi:hypothetical protein